MESSSTLYDDSDGFAGSISDAVLSNECFNQKYEGVISDQITANITTSSGPIISIEDEVSSTAGKFGRCWRFVFRKILTWCSDPVNALRISRPLQLQIDYLGPHEAFVLGAVVDALDRIVAGEAGAKENLYSTLVQALKVRNVGRVIVQNAWGPLNVLWHLHFQLSNTRRFKFASRIPLLLISFPPPSENFLSTKRHVVNSILRRLLGPGRWLTRVVTRGREEFIVDDDKATSQNLAAETTGFEEAMRQQYGNYFGRQRINAYRAENRLPTDESVVRTFFTQPMPTLINNGLVHVLRTVAKHWKATLNNPYGIFGNQRMEMLDVAQTLRFHMPVVLLALANFRGLDSWDSKVLAPLVKDLMNYKVGESIQESSEGGLIDRLEKAAENVCGGVLSRVVPFRDWVKQIKRAADILNSEKDKVKSIVEPVVTGIKAGYHLIQSVDWITPDDDVMELSILNHLKLDKAKKLMKSVQNAALGNNNKELKEKEIEALGQLNFNDLDFVTSMIGGRRLRVEMILLKVQILDMKGRSGLFDPLNDLVNKIERGYQGKVSKLHKEVVKGIRAYIQNDNAERKKNKMTDDMCRRALEFVKPRDKRTLIEMVMNGLEKDRAAKLLLGRVKTLLERELRRKCLDDEIAKCSENNAPFAESIVRAQKSFMTIELDLTRRFSYNAFMEFEDLRSDLGKLLIVSQIQCRSLDNARLQRLVGIRDNCPAKVAPNDMVIGTEYFVETAYKMYESITYNGRNIDTNKDIFKGPPQDTLVIGGGPSGLLTALHCIENCLLTGGEMKLYESRDAFVQAGGTYERAQVVRLDSRWVRMLRYHLGTSFEDVWIPASGETDAHLGNTLPTQGFIEITIKDLENVLHLEISKLASLNLIYEYSGSNASFDYKENKITKLGNALKPDDLVKLPIDKDGNDSSDFHTWRVAEMEFHESLKHEDLEIDETYYIFDRSLLLESNRLKSVKLVGINKLDEDNPRYTFENKDHSILREVDAKRFPRIYAGRDYKTKAVVFQSVDNEDCKHEVDFDDIKNETFVVDVGQTNVVFATGKPAAYDDHLKVTQEEPYGVCCIQGLKISLNMHNFGEKRWGDGIVDDIRSQTEQNTRVVGDFTKNVRVVPIAEEMIRLLSTDDRAEDWEEAFDDILEGAASRIVMSLRQLNPKKWVRKYLQTRFFETGDNFYLGMEFPREYDRWKKNAVSDAVQKIENTRRTSRKLNAVIDRLWYEAAFAVISRGDVYNPSGSTFIPKVYLISVKRDAKLHTLQIGDNFRLSGDSAMENKYEVLIPGKDKVWVRNVEGILSELDGTVDVLRQSDLTRRPDGYRESKVAIATFPVAHIVSHRTLNMQKSQHWCTFPIGDSQSSPHFMRYSGLTGAGINSMLVNNYIGGAIDHHATSAKGRAFELSKETNWSNEEVVHRGTGANFGVDGFLRPGFKYADMVEYLYYKAVEMDVYPYSDGTGQSMGELCDSFDTRIDDMFHRTWLQKFGAALVPRGMEVMTPFIRALESILEKKVLTKISVEMHKANIFMDEDDFFVLFREMYGGVERVSMRMEGNGDLMCHTKSRWGKHVEDLLRTSVSSDVAKEQIRKYMDRANIMVDVLRKSYLVARDDVVDGKRISSESENQPKSVDYLVADLPGEAQLFANGLGRSSLLATLSLALTTFGTREDLMDGNFGKRTIIWFGAFLAFTNIFVAFGTMTNVSRYQNRNEEFRTEFLKKKLPRFELSVFRLLSISERRRMNSNPFVRNLRKSFAEFIGFARYYDASCDEIEGLYKAMDVQSVESVEGFMNQIITYFIPVVYQEKVYLKDSLFNVYKAAEERLELLRIIEQANSNVKEKKIVTILNSLPKFTSSVERTLQTGPIKYGFWRAGRGLSQSIFTAPSRYRLLSISNVLAYAGCTFSTTARIKYMHRRLTKFNEDVGCNRLRCEVQDMKEFFHASMESVHASTVYCVACLSFTLALLSTTLDIIIAFLPSEGEIFMFPKWLGQPFMVIQDGSALANAFASYLAMEYFLKLCYHQRKVVRAVNRNKARRISPTLQKLGRIAKFQSYVSLLSATAAFGALIALISGMLDRRFNMDPYFDTDIVVGVAANVFGIWCIAGLGRFYIEFFLLWNFGPTAGKEICDHFKPDLRTIYDKYAESNDDEDIIRDYTAREFLVQSRFDSSLDADRFSAIMHTILSKEFSMRDNEAE